MKRSKQSTWTNFILEKCSATPINALQYKYGHMSCDQHYSIMWYIQCVHCICSTIYMYWMSIGLDMIGHRSCDQQYRIILYIQSVNAWFHVPETAMNSYVCRFQHHSDLQYIIKIINHRSLLLHVAWTNPLKSTIPRLTRKRVFDKFWSVGQIGSTMVSVCAIRNTCTSWAN